MFKKAVVLVLVVFMIASVLVGFSTPKSAKSTINVCVGPDPETIDPALNNSLDGGTYILHAFEGLTRAGKSGRSEPGMASKWEISKDGTVYTFHLRNAKWSDGKPVRAQDFEYAWKRALDPKTAAEYAYQLYYLKNGEEYNSGKAKAEDVGVKAVDDKTLVVTLIAPTAYFIDLMHFPTYMPVRKDIIEKYGNKWALKPESYIGNGAFVMTAFKSKDEIIMKKNLSYWNKGSINISQIRFKLIEDDAASLSSFESGDLDISHSLPIAETQNLIKSGKAKVHELLGTYYLYFNIKKEPLTDVKVRKALVMAIDRTYIVQKVTMAGQIPAVGVVPYKVPGATAKKDFRAEAKDLYGTFISPTAQVEEARKLLADAGYPDGKGFPEIEAYYNMTSGNKKIMEAIQQQWKVNLGITVKNPVMEWKVLQQKIAQKDYVITRLGWIGDYADPMTFLDMFTTNSGNNNLNFSSKQYDDLIATAKGSGDQAVRMKAMHEAEKIFMDEVPACPIYYYVGVWLESPKLKGHIIDSLGFANFQYAYTVR